MKFVLLVAFVLLCSTIISNGQEFEELSEFYTTIKNRRIENARETLKIELLACFQKCSQEYSWCQSFSFYSGWLANYCELSDLTLTQLVSANKLTTYNGYTTYITNFRAKFQVISNHILALSGETSWTLKDQSPEECAKQCFVSFRPRCNAFLFDRVNSSALRCTLTSDSIAGNQALHPLDKVDVYERLQEISALRNYFSYGSTQLLNHVYQVRNATSIEICAKNCYPDEDCKSIDYDFSSNICTFNTASASDYPNDLKISTDLKEKKIHYDKHDDFTKYFYSTSFKRIDYTAIKILNETNIPRCAKECLYLAPQICRSFTYYSNQQNCLLYDVEDNDVNILVPDENDGVTIHFDLKPSLECVGDVAKQITVLQDSGVITSPQWPHNFPLVAECTWRFAAPPGKQTFFKVTHFNLGNKDSPCSRNSPFVKMIPDESTSSTVTYCADNSMTKSYEEYKSFVYSQFMDIKFNSNGAITAQGFKILFKTEYAYGSLKTPLVLNSGNTGYIANPNYPLRTNQSAAWQIQLPKNAKFYLSFTEFSIGQNVTNCENTSKIEVDGKSFCGSTESLDIVVQVNNPRSFEIKLLPNVNELVNFNLVYTFNDIIQIPSGCRKEIILNNDTKSITWTSPGFNGKSVLSEGVCDYVIRNPFGKFQIQFTRFNVGQNAITNCNYAFITSDDDDIFRKLCGNLDDLQSSTIVSSSNEMFLSLVILKIGKFSFKGFSAVVTPLPYTTMQPPTIQPPIDCANFNLLNYLRSPNFPNNYPKYSDCQRTIFSPENDNKQIRLTFTNFSLTQFTYRDVSVCTNDQLFIWDSIIPQQETQLVRMCGQESLPKIFFSSSGSLNLHFTSDGGDTAPGFNANIDYVNTFVCKPRQSVIIDNDGYLLTPNFPNEPQKATQCEWLLTSPNNQSFSLDYEVFFVGGNKSAVCSNGQTNTFILVIPQEGEKGPFCGTNKPNVLEVPDKTVIKLNIMSTKEVSISMKVTQINTKTTILPTASMKLSTAALTPTLGLSTATLTQTAKLSTAALTPTMKLSTAAITQTTKLSSAAITPTIKFSTAAVTPTSELSTAATTPTIKLSTAAIIPTSELSTAALTPPKKLSTAAITPTLRLSTAALTARTKLSTTSLRTTSNFIATTSKFTNVASSNYQSTVAGAVGGTLIICLLCAALLIFQRNKIREYIKRQTKSEKYTNMQDGAFSFANDNYNIEYNKNQAYNDESVFELTDIRPLESGVDIYQQTRY